MLFKHGHDNFRLMAQAGNDGSVVFNPQLRELLFRCLRPPGIRSAAKQAHRFFAGSSARALLRCESVRSVTLRGGTLSHFLPAVSDIDLTLHVDSPESEASWVRTMFALREAYCRSKTFVPALGEVLILDRQDREFLEASKSFLLFSSSPEKVLAGENLCIQYSARPTDAGSFMNAISLYELAFRKMRQFATGELPHLREAEIRRDLKKILRQAGRAVGTDLSLSQLFALAFERLDELATRLLAKTFPPTTGEKLGPWRSPPQETFPEESETGVQWWLGITCAVRKKGKFSCASDSRRFLWEPSAPAFTKDLFEAVNKRFDRSFFPLSVLSPAAEKCRLMGLTLNLALLGIPDVPESWLEDPELHPPLLSFVRERTYEMAVMQYFLMPFHLVALSYDRTREWLKELCARTMMLETGIFSHGWGPVEKSKLFHAPHLWEKTHDLTFDPHDPLHMPLVYRTLSEIRSELTPFGRAR